MVRYDFATDTFESASDDLHSVPVFITSDDDQTVYIMATGSQASTYLFETGEGITAADIDTSSIYSGASSRLSPIEAVGAISPSEELIVTNSGRVYNFALELVTQIAASGHGLAFSPDGSELYSVDTDGYVRVLDTATWETVSVFYSGQGGRPEDDALGDVLQLSSDGTTLAQIGTYGLQIVDLATVERISSPGDDVIIDGYAHYGLAGDDTLGGPGINRMVGGTGDDTFYVDNISDTVSEAAGEGYDIVYTTVDFRTEGHVEVVTYTGDGDIQIFTDAGSQVIRGGVGNDHLGGGRAIDTLIGGHGNDTYHVGHAGDIVVEHAGEGIDTVVTRLASYTLGTNIERLEMERSGDTVAIGNNLSNYISGWFENDVLHGRGGDDTIWGRYGNDVLHGEAGDDVLLGDDGNDYLSGGEGNDVLQGGDGFDRFFGGNGDDTIDGGSGSDTAHYEGASRGVTIALGLEGYAQDTGGAGIDTLTSIENVTGTRFNDVLEGNNADNMLAGRGGNDELNGGRGNDVIDGGHGRDTASFLFTGAGVTVSLELTHRQDTGGAGQDLLVSIENLQGSFFDDTLTGTDTSNTLDGHLGDDTLHGLAGLDILTGGEGSDTLFGGYGYDSLQGDAGDDVLHGGFGNDILLGGEGNDRLIGNDNDDILGGGSGTDTLIGGFGADQLSGGADNDVLEGSAGADVLNGDHGYDYLDGGGGADILFGGYLADVLKGSYGKDVMTGGHDADGFVFENLRESGRFAVGADTITDFSQADNDTIRIGSIDADISTSANDRFTFIGTETFSGTAGELRYEFDGSGDTLIFMDVDGDYVSDMAIRLTGEITLEVDDFVGVDVASAFETDGKSEAAPLPSAAPDMKADLAFSSIEFVF